MSVLEHGTDAQDPPRAAELAPFRQLAHGARVVTPTSTS